jgi:predicted PurR-regulated permease PerM
MHENGEATTCTPPAPPMVREEGPLATGERFRPVALAGLTVVLIGLCLLLAVPFLPAITWGVALAVIAWPLHAWVMRRVVSHPIAAATLSSVVVIAAIAVPGVFVAYQLAREASSAAGRIDGQPPEGAVRDAMAGTPGLGGAVAWAERANVDIAAELRNLVQSVLGNGTDLARGSLAAIIQAALAAFILFYLLRDRAWLLAGVRRLLPMSRAEADRVFESAAGSVYANLYAALVTSAVNGTLGGLLFWAVGLPSPVLWGVVIFVVSLLPVVGIFLVWMPAAVYLALVGNWGGSVALVVWGVVTSVVVDTLLYTRLAGDRMRLHPIPTLLAFVGGLFVFGPSGVILGPGILAVTVAVLEVWHSRVVGGSPATAAPDAGAPAVTAARSEPAGMSVAPVPG